MGSPPIPHETLILPSGALVDTKIDTSIHPSQPDQQFAYFFIFFQKNTSPEDVSFDLQAFRRLVWSSLLPLL